MDISIIIPTWNRKDQLLLLLNDLCNQQTNYKYEIIVADSLSPDGTADAISAVSKIYKNVSIVQTDNILAVKRNAGVMNSSGKYLLLLDDDMRLNSNTVIQETTNELINQPGVALSGSVRYPKDWVASSNYYRYRNSRHIWDETNLGAEVPTWRFVAMCMAVERDIYIAVNGFSEGFKHYGGEDHDFEFKLRRLNIKIVSSTKLSAVHCEGSTGVHNYMRKIVMSSATMDFFLANWPEYLSARLLISERISKRLKFTGETGVQVVYAIMRFIGAILDKTDKKAWVYCPSLYRIITLLSFLKGRLEGKNINSNFYG